MDQEEEHQRTEKLPVEGGGIGILLRRPGPGQDGEQCVGKARQKPHHKAEGRDPHLRKDPAGYRQDAADDVHNDGKDLISCERFAEQEP